jgi:hypothetical protein
MTLPGSVMPARIRPRPNSSPIANSVSRCMVIFLRTSGLRRAGGA